MRNALGQPDLRVAGRTAGARHHLVRNKPRELNVIRPLSLTGGLACCLLVLGAGEAQGAEIIDHEPFTPESNQISYWCGSEQGGYKLEDVSGAEIWLSDVVSPRVVVKAGSGEFANTVYGGVKVGDGVWADTNGNTLFDVGGQNGDKTISHVIVCRPEMESETPAPTPTPTESASVQPTTPESISASPSPSTSESEPVVPAKTPLPGPPGPVVDHEEGGQRAQLELPGTGLDVGLWSAGAGAVLVGAVLWAGAGARGVRRGS